jgi:hypothetical protein
MKRTSTLSLALVAMVVAGALPLASALPTGSLPAGEAGVAGGVPPQADALKDGPFDRLVIRNAMIIPGHGGPPTGPSDIVIEGGTIARVGRARPNEQFDREIDATGMYVMPGLIDLHTHIRGNELPYEYVYYMKLAHGVTTMANAADRGFDNGLEQARLSNANEIIAPRMYPLHGWRPDAGDPEPTRWEDPAWAPELARELIDEKGAHVVSVGSLGWNPELFGAVANAVYDAGGITTVHLPPSSNAQVQSVRAAELGVTMLEHHYGYAESALDRTVQDFPPDYGYNDELDRFRHAGKVWQQAPLDRLYGEVVDRLVASGVAMIPTMAVYEANRDINRAMGLPWHEKYTHRALIDWSFPKVGNHGAYHWDWTSDDEVTWSYTYRTWQKLIYEFNSRGGLLGSATDDNYIWATGGISNIRELQLMQETGIHPLEVIKAATYNNAKILRRPDLGLIRPGYTADLLIINGNPLHSFRLMYAFGAMTLDENGDFSHEGGIRWTVKDGVVFDNRGMMREVERIVAESKVGWTNPVDALMQLPTKRR